MKKIKYLLLAILIIFILGISFLAYGFIRNNESNKGDVSLENEENEETSISDESYLNAFATNPDYVIKSTEKNPLSMGDIEVVDIAVQEVEEKHLEIKTTIKNKSNKEINGFYIEIELLDKNNKKIIDISKDTPQKIEPNGTYILTNSIMGLTNGKDIVKAKIISFDRDITSEMNEFFEETEKEIQEQIGQ